MSDQERGCGLEETFTIKKGGSPSMVMATLTKLMSDRGGVGLTRPLQWTSGMIKKRGPLPWSEWMPQHKGKCQWVNVWYKRGHGLPLQTSEWTSRKVVINWPSKRVSEHPVWPTKGGAKCMNVRNDQGVGLRLTLPSSEWTSDFTNKGGYQRVSERTELAWHSLWVSEHERMSSLSLSGMNPTPLLSVVHLLVGKKTMPPLVHLLVRALLLFHSGLRPLVVTCGQLKTTLPSNGSPAPLSLVLHSTLIPDVSSVVGKAHTHFCCL